MIEVTCWCERFIVLVPRRAWLRGFTHSCGHPSCRNPAGVTVMAKVTLNDRLAKVTPPWRAA